MRAELFSASCTGKVQQAGEVATAGGAFVAAGGQPAGSSSKARAETEVKINNTTNKSKSNHLRSAQLCPELGRVASGCPPRAAQREELLGPRTERHPCGLPRLPAPGGDRGVVPGFAHHFCSLQPGGAAREGRGAGPPPHPPGVPPSRELCRTTRGICRGYGAGERRGSAGSPGAASPHHLPTNLHLPHPRCAAAAAWAAVTPRGGHRHRHRPLRHPAVASRPGGTGRPGGCAVGPGGTRRAGSPCSTGDGGFGYLQRTRCALILHQP